MDELDLARQLADMAAELALHYFSRDPEVTTKADGTLVTIADREIERMMRKQIQAAFPSHGIVGEEEGVAGDRDAPIWVLDPIDGTNNFAWGIPIFATLIGLRVNGRTELGIANAPALNERYEAWRGGGAWMNGMRIHVSEIGNVAEARFCYGSHTGIQKRGFGDRWWPLLESSRRDRGYGDFWGHMLVARGAAEVMAEPSLAIWDVAALEVIVEEAGGKITGFSGAPYPEERLWAPTGDGSCLTTNGLLHDTVVEALTG